MNFSNELLFFFSALGVFNALLISLYFFFFKKPKHISNFFFGLLLLVLAIRVGKSVVFYFNPDLANFFIKIGLSACLLIGPAHYFYTLSVIKPTYKTYAWSIHFMILLGIAISIGVYFSDTFNPQFGGIYWLTIVYNVWLAYLIATAYVLRHHFVKIFKRNKKLAGLDFWLLSVFFGILIIYIAYKTVSYTSYIVGALSFTFIFYLLILLIFFNRKKKAIFNSKEKYANKKIEISEASEMLSTLKTVMISEKLYKNALLKLPDVAQKLNIPPHTLSQLLNDNLDKNFTNYINEHRVEEAKKMIFTEDKLTLEAIGHECGFNSKSTFYAAFKKFTGTTPAKFKENN